jgi:bifunctional non-homologous end joining protein LigD
MPDALSKYRRKRNFRATPEPAGKVSRKMGRTFVVQKHDATRLHYDFRLELDGVLLSWAVTRGPSLNPADKRLAVRTEDHPVEYGSFEGVIPSGYGAGTVIIWDRGIWTPEEEPHEALRKGALRFTLHGRRLKGGWALVRMKPRPGERKSKENWLLIKHRDRHASETTIATEKWNDSVKSHRTNDQMPGSSGRLTSPAKLLWPESGVSKRDLADYLDAQSDRLLAFVKGRPLSIVRCPEGRLGKCFFQKHNNASMPGAIGSVRISEKKGGIADYLVIRGRAGLTALAQIGGLELHVWGAREDKLENPERLVFDLDPDEGLGFAEVRNAAFELRDSLSALGLRSFPLLTGGKGVHVVVPIARKRSWNDVRTFCRGVAEQAAGAAPERYVAQASKAKRKGKIFIDWLRNDRGATAIAPYSPRNRAGAPIATPVSWDELRGIGSAAAFDIRTIGRRLAKLRIDPWKGYAQASRQTLRAAAIKSVARGR